MLPHDTLTPVSHPLIDPASQHLDPRAATSTTWLCSQGGLGIEAPLKQKAISCNDDSHTSQEFEWKMYEENGALSGEAEVER